MLIYHFSLTHCLPPTPFHTAAIIICFSNHSPRGEGSQLNNNDWLGAEIHVLRFIASCPSTASSKAAIQPDYSAQEQCFKRTKDATMKTQTCFSPFLPLFLAFLVFGAIYTVKGKMIFFLLFTFDTVVSRARCLWRLSKGLQEVCVLCWNVVAWQVVIHSESVMLCAVNSNAGTSGSTNSTPK